MAVYTPLDQADFNQFLSLYEIGSLVSFSEISAGIENSNFFLVTSLSDAEGKRITRDWVVTIFENVVPDELPFFEALTGFLQQSGFAVPAPVADRSGNAILEIKGKKGVIVPRIPGSSVDVPKASHCEKLGQYLARMHLALKGFSQIRPIERTLEWMKGRQSELVPHLSTQEVSDLELALQQYQQNLPEMNQCPKGIIHGDLFRDNVLFERVRNENQQIAGIIDFYHAGEDHLLYDLAVIANDWAVNAEGEILLELESALLSGYQSERPWSEHEYRCWSCFKQLAALRFWLSRLRSRHIPGYQTASVSGDQTKDPEEMRRILKNNLP